MGENSPQWCAGTRSSVGSTLGVTFNFVVSIRLLLSPIKCDMVSNQAVEGSSVL